MAKRTELPRIESLRCSTPHDPMGERTFDPDSVCVRHEGGITLMSAEKLLRLGFMRDPGSPTNLAQLADFVRRKNPRAHRVADLLDFLHDNAEATFDELRESVYAGYGATEDTIKGHVREAKSLIKKMAIAVEIKRSRSILYRIYKTE